MFESKLIFSPTERVDFMTVEMTEGIAAGAGAGTGVLETLAAGSTVTESLSAAPSTVGFTPKTVTSMGGGTAGAAPTSSSTETTKTVSETPTPGPSEGTIAKLMDEGKSTESATAEKSKEIAASLSTNILWAILFVISAAFAGYLFVAKK